MSIDYILNLIIIILLIIIIILNIVYYLKKTSVFHESYNNYNKNLDGNNVFIYWVGHEYKLIKILRQLMYYHSNNGYNYNLHLVTDKNLHNYLNNLPSVFNKLCKAHQADYVRVNLVYKYGGIWLDSDIIVMDNLNELFNIINEKDGFFINEGWYVYNGLFGSKKNTELMKLWKIKIDEKLKNNTDGKLEWIEIGSKILVDIREKNNHLYNNYKIFEGQTDMYPILPNDTVEEYINKPYENYKKIEKEFQPLIILVGAVYHNLENKKNIEDIINSNMPINYFLNKSLLNCNKSKTDLINDINNK